MLGSQGAFVTTTTTTRATSAFRLSLSTQRRAFVRPSWASMAPTPIPLPRHVCDALGLAEHEVAFREGSATIVLPSQEAAFLNPVQEFNRDLSTLALRAWSELRNEEKHQRFIQSAAARRRKNKGRKRAKEGDEEGVKRARTEDETTDTLVARPEGGGDGGGVDGVERENDVDVRLATQEAGPSTAVESAQDGYRPYRFTILEALSATGLRSIRYAREIPLLRSIVANDLSTTAVEAMKRNVALNFPAGRPIEPWQPAPATEGDAKGEKSAQKINEDTIADIENGIETSSKAVNGKHDNASFATTTATTTTTTPSSSSKVATAIHPNCKVITSEADAISLMYAHREEKKRFDVIDLDPYGSASMFLDGAVQAVADGGLLAITCTDTAVLAGTSHPEKCYSAYGGVTTRAEYSHEFALRLLLHAIATSAGRYGRHIEPMLSLSIDFYVRVFVRVHTRPVEVKRLASQTGAVFTCTGCQLHSALPFGRHHQTEGQHGQTNDKYQAGSGPNVGPFCDECGSRFHTAGPMWLGALHDPSFCQAMLATVEREPERFATRARIQGMVGTAAEELGPEALFFFTPSRVSSFFRCSSPPMVQVVSALLHAGHQVSRSHCQPGSIKTSATRSEVYDLWRAFVQRSPVKMDSISESAPAKRLLCRRRTSNDDGGGEDEVRSPVVQWNLDEEHKDAKSIIQGSASSKGTRYQLNPLPNWGPGTAARTTRAK